MAMKACEVRGATCEADHAKSGAFRTSHLAPRTESGQSILLFAVLIPVTVLFVLGIMDYMVTNARVMATLAAADLAAHAGAQVVDVLPNGAIRPNDTAAEATAAAYFQLQAPPVSVLGAASCSLIDGRPGCRLTAAVRSAGYLIPQRWIGVEAVGYLAYGVTEDDQ